METWRKKRLASVDFLRGLAMAGMVLANNPGDRNNIYPQLRHAAWHGLTLADCIFPMFLFLVGVCVALAIDRDRALAGQAPGLWSKVAKRAAVLFLLGLAENAYLGLRLDALRIPGVLQRIAVVYLATAWLHVRLDSRRLAALVAAVLVGYWLVLALVPVPGLGQPSLSREANLQGWLDQLVFGGHIWKLGTTWDPEGLLSTFPAVALGGIGVLAGRWLRSGKSGAVFVAVAGLAMLGLAVVWDAWFPINKSICTSSFVLFVGGVGLAFLAGCHWLMDRRGLVAWARPFVILGTNPLAVYVAASLLASTLRHVKLADGRGGVVTLQQYLYGWLFSGLPDPALASLAWALTLLAVLFCGAWALYARHLVIKA